MKTTIQSTLKASKRIFLLFNILVVLQVISCSPNDSFINDELLTAEAKASMQGEPELFLSGFQGASGSAIGPAGDLFIPEGTTGAISRVDLRTGEVSTFASGLPTSIIGLGGAIDLVFKGETAYVLVTLVGPQFGGTEAVGIYRIDGPESHTLIADIGEFALNNPPETNFFVEMGVQYSIENFRDGFLVADGHLNYLFYITTEGDISIFRKFGNIVPTGLDVHGKTIYMAEAGPVPHEPEDGKIIGMDVNTSESYTIATGCRLIVDVEFGRGRTMFGLSQGIWDEGAEGSPAFPDTGALMKVNEEGGFDLVADGLDRPTSMEIVQNTAYIITLTGDVWKIDNIAHEPFGK